MNKTQKGQTMRITPLCYCRQA